MYCKKVEIISDDWIFDNVRKLGTSMLLHISLQTIQAEHVGVLQPSQLYMKL